MATIAPTAASTIQARRRVDEGVGATGLGVAGSGAHSGSSADWAWISSTRCAPRRRRSPTAPVWQRAGRPRIRVVSAPKRDQPHHPPMAALLLVIGVLILIVLLAVASL